MIGVTEESHAPSAERASEGRNTLAVFAGLPAEQRAILLLVSVEGFSYREAADALGVPIGTVMSRLSRAREKLRQLAEGRAAPVDGGCTTRAEAAKTCCRWPMR